MESSIRIEDHTIWFKHVSDPKLRTRLMASRDEEGINFETDGVVGRPSRMRTGKDGRRTAAIKPEGGMKEVWN